MEKKTKLENTKKLKRFQIPMTCEVWDKVEVVAETIEEAVQYVKDNINEIPLGTEPEYIDGSYKIDDGDNGEIVMPPKDNRGGERSNKASPNARVHERQKESLKTRGDKLAPSSKKAYKKAYTDFNEMRFKGLNHNVESNKYMTMDRVNKDKTKVVVRIGDTHLVPTKYGYAVILDDSHVAFIKDWQVNRNYFGTEVLMDKQYFKVKKWGSFDNFIDGGLKDWNEWVSIAEAQQKHGTKVKWQI